MAFFTKTIAIVFFKGFMIRRVKIIEGFFLWYKKGGGPLSGTLYVSSLMTPPNVLLSVERNVEFVLKALVEICSAPGFGIVTTQSSTSQFRRLR